MDSILVEDEDTSIENAKNKACRSVVRQRPTPSMLTDRSAALAVDGVNNTIEGAENFKQHEAENGRWSWVKRHCDLICEAEPSAFAEKGLPEEVMVK